MKQFRKKVGTDRLNEISRIEHMREKWLCEFYPIKMKLVIEMKLKFVNFFALFFTVTLLIAQPYSSELDSILQHRLDSLQLQIGYKGIGVAIQCSDGHIWTGSRGISSINPTVEVTNQDAYQIGSVTKTMTAACILQMEEESLLDLDDSISLYLDEYISGNAFIDPNITIRQLLRHESGLFDVFANASLQPTLMNQMDSVWLVPDIISTFLQAPLFDAGTSWSYSSTNYLLLSLIIEEISGQPYYAEMRERFFDPLELNSIVFPAYESFNSPVAHVWINIFGGPATEDAHSFWTNYLSMNSAAGAAGAYYGTPHDINTWTWKLFRGDLFSVELLDQMTTTVNAPGLPNSTYGL
jgi:D-alanyl-D-alanine carboxypeptidase